MRFFRRIAGFLGFGGHDDTKDEDDDLINNNNYSNSGDFRRNRMNADPIPAYPRRGFSVPVQVLVDWNEVGPILIPCHVYGGVQGLKWYAKRLKTDEDGDVADEFLDEVLTEMSSIPQDQVKPFPRFEVKHTVRDAKIKQVLTSDGKLQHCVDSQGQLQWV